MFLLFTYTHMYVVCAYPECYHVGCHVYRAVGDRTLSWRCSSAGLPSAPYRDTSRSLRMCGICASCTSACTATTATRDCTACRRRAPPSTAPCDASSTLVNSAVVGCANTRWCHRRIAWFVSVFPARIVHTVYSGGCGASCSVGCRAPSRTRPNSSRRHVLCARVFARWLVAVCIVGVRLLSKTSQICSETENIGCMCILFAGIAKCSFSLL